MKGNLFIVLSVLLLLTLASPSIQHDFANFEQFAAYVHKFKEDVDRTFKNKRTRNDSKIVRSLYENLQLIKNNYHHFVISNESIPHEQKRHVHLEHFELSLKNLSQNLNRGEGNLTVLIKDGIEAVKEQAENLDAMVNPQPVVPRRTSPRDFFRGTHIYCFLTLQELVCPLLGEDLTAIVMKK